MRRILKITTKLKLDLFGLVRLSIFSTALVLLTNCVATPKFPARELYEYDSALGVCGVYKIVNTEKIEFEFVKDIPLTECPTIFGFSAADAPKVLDWASDRMMEAKQK